MGFIPLISRISVTWVVILFVGLFRPLLISHTLLYQTIGKSQDTWLIRSHRSQHLRLCSLLSQHLVSYYNFIFLPPLLEFFSKELPVGRCWYTLRRPFHLIQHALSGLTSLLHIVVTQSLWILCNRRWAFHTIFHWFSVNIGRLSCLYLTHCLYFLRHELGLLLIYNIQSLHIYTTNALVYNLVMKDYVFILDLYLLSETSNSFRPYELLRIARNWLINWLVNLRLVPTLASLWCLKAIENISVFFLDYWLESDILANFLFLGPTIIQMLETRDRSLSLLNLSTLRLLAALWDILNLHHISDNCWLLFDQILVNKVQTNCDLLKRDLHLRIILLLVLVWSYWDICICVMLIGISARFLLRMETKSSLVGWESGTLAFIIASNNLFLLRFFNYNRCSHFTCLLCLLLFLLLSFNSLICISCGLMK